MSHQPITEEQRDLAADVRADYDAIRNGVAVLEFPAGKLQLSGKNAIQFLNGLVSNEVKTLQAGDGVLATFPTLQGKLAALCRIYNIGDHLLMELDAINREKIFKNLSRFVPAGEFFVTDVSEHFAMLSLQGPRSAELIEAVTDQPLGQLQQFRIVERQIANADVFIAAHQRCGEDGYDLFVRADDAARVKQMLLRDGKNFGAREVGDAAFQI
ncbi:MAG: hypothetical protein AAB401_10810, partial [Acidobacteriota bacterium]